MFNETGRSMVEMLGVLAVIGVLSIAGISGYQTSMTRYRANEILYVANTILNEQAAVKLSGGTLTKANISMGKLPDGCWIGSFNQNPDYLYIGGCTDGKIMDTIKSIVGDRWKKKTGATCGKLVANGTSTEVKDTICSNCKNGTTCSLVYDNN